MFSQVPALLRLPLSELVLFVSIIDTETTARALDSEFSRVINLIQWRASSVFLNVTCKTSMNVNVNASNIKWDVVLNDQCE